MNFSIFCILRYKNHNTFYLIEFLKEIYFIHYFLILIDSVLRFLVYSCFTIFHLIPHDFNGVLKFRTHWRCAALDWCYTEKPIYCATLLYSHVNVFD